MSGVRVSTIGMGYCITLHSGGLGWRQSRGVRFDRNGAATDRGAERARWVADYRASGLGLKQLAHENGLKESQLRYWVCGGGRKRVRLRPGTDVAWVITSVNFLRRPCSP